MQLMTDASDIATRAVEKYDKGGISTWDFILAKELGFLEGNIIKYIVRYETKGGVKDLLKARTYLDRLIEFHNERS